MELVVLGAGPAGLAAAWRAARAGHAVTVLERGSTVGGMAASFTVGGIRVDHGSHRLHPGIEPRLLADLTALLGNDLQLRARNGRLHIAGRWIGFPLQPGSLARLPPSVLAGIAFDTLSAPVRYRRTPPASYAEALRRGLGPTLYRALYEPYAVKLWGLPGTAIDPEQARRRVSADTPWKIATRMLGSRDPDRPGRAFRYPRRGFGQLTDALADAAAAAGADIRLDTPARKLTARPDGVQVTTPSGSIDAEHVFSTIPLPVLARISEPLPPRLPSTPPPGWASGR